jgi:hypothetical protein
MQRSVNKYYETELWDAEMDNFASPRLHSDEKQGFVGWSSGWLVSASACLLSAALRLNPWAKTPLEGRVTGGVAARRTLDFLETRTEDTMFWKTFHFSILSVLPQSFALKNRHLDISGSVQGSSLFASLL